MTEASIWRAPYRGVTLANLTVMAVVAFDGLAVAAALPSIADDLGDVALVPWVITSFLATSAIAGIAAGPVVDAVGVRRMFRVTGAIFFVASVMVAIAPSMPLLIVARTLQGIGGGLIISVQWTSIGLAYPERLRTHAYAVNSTVWGVLGFGGPVIVAAMLAIGSWRLVFVAQLPLTALALVVGWSALPSTRDRPAPVRVDAGGLALVTLVVVGSLVGLSQLGQTWWVAVAGLVPAAFAALALWRRSDARPDAIIERQHVTRRPLRAIHAVAGLTFVAALGANNYLPIYAQTVRGWSEAEAAFTVLFLTVGWTTGAWVVSRRIRHRTEAQLVSTGVSLVLPGMIVVGVAIAASWSMVVVLVAYFAVGLGVGHVSTGSLSLLQRSSDPSEMGRTNSAHQFVRTVSITYAVAIAGALFVAVVERQVGDVELIRDLLGGEQVIISRDTFDSIRDGFTAMHVFAGVGGVAAVAAAMSLRRAVRDLPGPD